MHISSDFSCLTADFLILFNSCELDFTCPSFTWPVENNKKFFVMQYQQLFPNFSFIPEGFTLIDFYYVYVNAPCCLDACISLHTSRKWRLIAVSVMNVFLTLFSFHCCTISFIIENVSSHRFNADNHVVGAIIIYKRCPREATIVE